MVRQWLVAILIKLRSSPVFFYLLRDLYHEWMLNFVKWLFVSNDTVTFSCLASLYEEYIDCYLNARILLNSEDEHPFGWKMSSFYILLDQI
jgi:hypothetical protein